MTTSSETQAHVIQSIAAQSRAIRAEIRKAILNKWLSEGDAAIYLGCSPNLINSLRREGHLKAGLLGKRWRYHVEDLDKAVITGRTV